MPSDFLGGSPGHCTLGIRPTRVVSATCQERAKAGWGNRQPLAPSRERSSHAKSDHDCNPGRSNRLQNVKVAIFASGFWRIRPCGSGRTRRPGSSRHFRGFVGNGTRSVDSLGWGPIDPFERPPLPTSKTAVAVKAEAHCFDVLTKRTVGACRVAGCES